MTNSPSIVPSETELRQWESLIFTGKEDVSTVLTQAFQAGADQELEACCEWMAHVPDFYTGSEIDLRSARRPKPPSMKEQALALLEPGEPRMFNSEMQSIIRQALEQLPND